MTAKRLRGGVLQLALVVCVGILLVPPSSALAACEEAPGLRYPTLDWRSINGGALPQAFRYRLKEDTIDVRLRRTSRRTRWWSSFSLLVRGCGEKRSWLSGSAIRVPAARSYARTLEALVHFRCGSRARPAVLCQVARTRSSSERLTRSGGTCATCITSTSIISGARSADTSLRSHGSTTTTVSRSTHRITSRRS